MRLAGPEAFQSTKCATVCGPRCHTLCCCFSVFMLPSSFCRDSEHLGLLLVTQAPSVPKNSASISATCRDRVVTECQLQWDRLCWPHLDLSRPVNHEAEMGLEVGKHTVVESSLTERGGVSGQTVLKVSPCIVQERQEQLGESGEGREK